jgi:hypothetical protein
MSRNLRFPLLLPVLIAAVFFILPELTTAQTPNTFVPTGSMSIRTSGSK